MKPPTLGRTVFNCVFGAPVFGVIAAVIFHSWLAFGIGMSIGVAIYIFAFAFAGARKERALPPVTDGLAIGERQINAVGFPGGTPPALAPAPYATAGTSPSRTIAELKAERARLLLRKRAIAQEMRSIRDAARMKNARVGGPNTSLIGSLIFGASTLRRIQRSGIRLGREEALAPLQAERDQIDRDITEIDRQIAENKSHR